MTFTDLEEGVRDLFIEAQAPLIRILDRFNIWNAFARWEQARLDERHRYERRLAIADQLHCVVCRKKIPINVKVYVWNLSMIKYCSGFCKADSAAERMRKRYKSRTNRDTISARRKAAMAKEDAHRARALDVHRPKWALDLR